MHETSSNAQATAAVQRWLETPGCQEEACAAVEDTARPRGRDRINPKQGAGCPLMRSVRVRGWLPVPSETHRRQRDLNAAPYPEIRGTVHLSAQPWDPKGRRRRERSEQDGTGWFSTPSTVRELWNIARRPREELQPKESSQAAYLPKSSTVPLSNAWGNANDLNALPNSALM